MVSTFDGNFAEILNYCDKHSIILDEKDYVWLSTIDPYGHTVISPLQINYFVSELMKLIKIVKDVAVKQSITNLAK